MQNLGTRWAGKRVEFYEEIDSTNRAAKDSGLENGTLFIARRQTMGRGRSGRGWQSGPGLGIYSSLLLRPDKLEARHAPRITVLAAVSVAEGLIDLGIDARIKWPNDIVVDGKKICGILCESVITGGMLVKAVMGAGINHLQNADDFDESFRNHATSVKMLLDEPPDRRAVLSAYMTRVEDNYDRALAGLLMSRYRELSATLGCAVRVFEGDEEWSGMAVELREDGCLVIELSDAERRVVAAGDVSVRGIMGYV